MALNPGDLYFENMFNDAAESLKVGSGTTMCRWATKGAARKAGTRPI